MITEYSKTCVKRPLKIDNITGLNIMTTGSLIMVESIAECSFGAFCNTFDLHKAIISLKTFLVLSRVAILHRF